MTDEELVALWCGQAQVYREVAENFYKKAMAHADHETRFALLDEFRFYSAKSTMLYRVALELRDRKIYSHAI